MISKDVSQRFMEKVVVVDSGCWNWTSTLNRGGYATFWFIDRKMAAHRVSYELFVGDSKGAWVLHKCDNRKCVNPKHLYLGDAKQNAKDRTERKRYRVMTPLTVIEKIRAQYATGKFTQQELADRHGVEQTQVSRYVLNKQRQGY